MQCCSSLAVKDDIALVQAARNGSDDALQALLLRYEPFIRAYSGFFSCAGVETEDLMQEGRIGLVSAIRLFRCDAGASFKTYACLCIKRQIVSAVRCAVSGKNKPMMCYVPLEDIGKNEIPYSDLQNPEDMVINKERISTVKAAVADLFSPVERRIFSLYLNGFSYDAIAKAMNISKKQVDNSLQHIKRKLSLIFD